jgi:hypothetical protein
MNRRQHHHQQQRIVHVRIGRLVVDEAALGRLPAAQLGDQVRQLLAQQLGGGTSEQAHTAAPLARQVATGVQAQVAPALSKQP